MARPQTGVHKRKGPVYNAWKNMVIRCTDTKQPFAYRYVNRGISFAKEWASFDRFYDDMAGSHVIGKTLDRIDNNKGYSPENCRWATPKEQANNTGRNRVFTINGVTKTLAQWCDESEVRPSTVRQRYYSYNWTIERSLGI